MNHLLPFALYESAPNVQTLYHGTDRETEAELRRKYTIFVSDSYDIAMNYGENIFEVTLDLGRVFDSRDPAHIASAYAAGFAIAEGDYGMVTDGETHPTPDDYLERADLRSTWWNVENTPGLIDWVFDGAGYDSLLLTEDGAVNHLTHSRRIVRAKIINGG